MGSYLKSIITQLPPALSVRKAPSIRPAASRRRWYVVKTSEVHEREPPAT